VDKRERERERETGGRVGRDTAFNRGEKEKFSGSLFIAVIMYFYLWHLILYGYSYRSLTASRSL
jgi:hypothetical protein